MRSPVRRLWSWQNMCWSWTVSSYWFLTSGEEVEHRQNWSHTNKKPVSCSRMTKMTEWDVNFMRDSLQIGRSWNQKINFKIQFSLHDFKKMNRASRTSWHRQKLPNCRPYHNVQKKLHIIVFACAQICSEPLSGWSNDNWLFSKIYLLCACAVSKFQYRLSILS